MRKVPAETGTFRNNDDTWNTDLSGMGIKQKRNGRTMYFDTLKITLTENNAYPKYIQLRDQIASFIQSNKIPADTQLPDIISLGKIAGLSNRSVERAYSMLINDGICFRRPKKGTFVRGDRPPRQSNMPKVCAILNFSSPTQLEHDDILGTIYRGIQEKAQEENLDVIILSERSLPVYRENFQSSLLGVIILSWYDHQVVRDLVEKYPDQRFVFLNFHLPDFENMPPQVTGIFNDDFAGGFVVGDYICSRGCRRPRILSIKQASDNYDRRIEGIRRAAHYHGIAIPDSSIYEIPSPVRTDEDQVELAQRFIHDMQKRGEKFDAVCCTNDLLATGAAAALDQLQLRDKVRVVGYDNIRPYLSSGGNFSTVAVNLEEMGKRAIATLVTKDSLPQLINIPPQLILRER